MTQTNWQSQGQVEYEVSGYDYDEHGYTGHGYYTGWCRYADGRLADGGWPCWNYRTGELRNPLKGG